MEKVGLKKKIILLVLVIIIAIIAVYFIGIKKVFKKELTRFELIGSKDIYLLLNGNYNDSKAMAEVNGKEYTENIKISNDCDTSKSGDCVIKYSIDGFDTILERNLHISDFSEWFKINYDSEAKEEKITIEIKIDKEKVSRYNLPNGYEKNEDDTFTIDKNGTYKFKIYDKYGNEYMKEITINNIVPKSIEAECKANVKQKSTVITVTANKKIIKYIYNGVSSEKDTYTFNQRVKSNKVMLYDNDNQSKEIVCTTKVEPYNSFGAYKHVFIIGVDGAGAAFGKTSTPNFDRIFSNYAYRHDANTEYSTVSAQNWGAIMMGVSYKTHGLTNDILASKQRSSKSKYLTIFYYVRKSIPSANLVSIVNWNPINYGLIEKDINVKKIKGSSDANVTNKVVDYLKSNKAPTLMFVHFDEVDESGHSDGGFSKAYYNEIKAADKRIGKIYDTVKSLGILKDSLFIVVADHGETTKGHGGHSKEESSAVLAVSGYTVNKVTLNKDVHNRDVSAIALYALGVQKPSHFITSVPNELFGEPRN